MMSNVILLSYSSNQSYYFTILLELVYLLSIAPLYYVKREKDRVI